MKISILSILLCLSSFSYGQKSNLVVFSENGEEFTLFVNGSRINEEPATNVKATGISADYVQIKINFEISGAPDVTSNIPIMESGHEMTYVVKKNNKGKYVTRFLSSNYIAETESSTEKVAIVSSPAPVSQPVATEPQSSPTTYTETTTTSQQPKTQNGFGISISAGGENISLNMSMDDGEQTHSTTTTTTSSTTYSSSNDTNPTQGQSNITARVENNQILLSDGRTLTTRKEAYRQSFTSAIEMKEPSGAKVTLRYNDLVLYTSDVPFFYADKNSGRSGAYFSLEVEEQSGKKWTAKLQLTNASKLVIDGGTTTSSYTSTPAPPSQPEVVVVESGCQKPMSPQDFNRAVESIDQKTFRDEKITVFKQVIKSNCISVNQVTEVMDLFDFEEDKLTVAKLAYPKTVDKGNYYQVNDAFIYSDSVSELEDFLSKQ